MKTYNIREVALSEIVDLPVHPVANILPMLDKTASKRDEGKNHTVALSELADSILEFGLQQPIVLFEGKILDGRNRREACAMAAKATGQSLEEFLVAVEDFEGTEDEADEFVFAAGFDRRDLDLTQRGMSAAKFEDECPEAFARMKEKAHLAQVEAADRTNAALGRGETLSPRLGESVSERAWVTQMLADKFRCPRSYVEDGRKILRDERDARRKAEEAAQRAEEFELAEAEAKAEIEQAKAVDDTEKIREAANKANNAAQHKAEEREKAAEYSTKASKLDNLAESLHNGKSSFYQFRQEKKKESTDDDPIGKLRSQVNQNVSNLKKIISELAILTDKGDEIYDFLGTRFQALCDHLQDEFSIEQEFDCYDSVEEVE